LAHLTGNFRIGTWFDPEVQKVIKVVSPFSQDSLGSFFFMFRLHPWVGFFTSWLPAAPGKDESALMY
jgi:hypothetical protein